MTKKRAGNKGRLTAVQQLQQKPNDFLIIGIGASAGGIQAMQEFFRHVPADSHMAYVVILHLSPDHDSQLANVLQRETTLPVQQVTEKTLLQPDHIYVVPPNRHLVIDQEYIAVLPNLSVEERRAPVDVFFRSLADQHGPRAISVILSGTGANGSMGIKRIKERGGATYVQNPREAEYNEMPRNSIATDLVDEVLNASEMPARIIAYRDSIGSVQIIEEAEKRPENQQQALREIFTQLRSRTGHDFSNYKRPTLLRRIERRINVHNLPDLPSYTAFMFEHPEETHALLKDLLISVTNFFRDSKAFDRLEQDIIPAIFAGKTSSDQVRVWVAGCATGEEAYSLAILCAEKQLELLDAPKVQIFATDIDEAAISTARDGLYTLNDAADVSPDRLSRFFNREGEGYRVRQAVRETIIFAQHNILKDPPFSKLDLVTCRNVLIYLNNTAQERVVETFHFALKPKGFLFLGTSESVDGASDLYAAYNRDHHIFQTREVQPRNYPVPEAIPQFQFPKNDPLQKPEVREARAQRISFGELHQRMLEQYAPPSVVVNEEYEIVHMSERVGQYFKFAGGEPTQNLLKLINPHIRMELRSALYQAINSKMAVEARSLQLKVNGVQQAVDILVRPVLSDGDTAKGFILVIIKPAQHAEPDVQTILLASDEPVARKLEKELIGIKTQLRNSVEQHEYQAEELKAMNEELQAMNEELRSAAEELETSKEELQSINEELRTVNQELKVKIDETGITSNNLQNLINSANVGTIFLDRSFAIRLYTPAVLDIFNLKMGDYGRPITDITHRLQYNNLLQDAESVLERLIVVEREVTTVDNRYFLMRLLPYRTAEDRINGVVVTFFEITQLKQSEKALRQSEEQTRLLIESAKDYAIFTIDVERHVLTWSRGAEMLMGYTEAEMKGQSGDIMFVPEDRASHVPEEEIMRANMEGRAENERWHLRKNGSRFWGSGLTQPLRSEQGETIGFVKIMRDLTEQREMQEALHQAEEKYRLQLEQEVADRTGELRENYALLKTIYNTTLVGMSVFAPVLDEHGQITDFKIILVNSKVERTAQRGDMTGKLYAELFPGIKKMGLFDLMVKTMESGETEKMEYRYTYEGIDNWYSTMFVRGDGLLVSTNLDITDRMLAEEKRLRAFVLLQQAEGLAGMGSWDYNLLNGTLTWSNGMYDLFNLPKETEIKPEIYLQYTTDDCKEKAERIAGYIKRGNTAFEETLTIDVGGATKILKLKATVEKNDAGEPVTVLGVDMDVTASRLAEEKFRQMESEQQVEIFRVTLRTQEEERRRVSESLHNGLGQLLYGIKISMNELTPALASQNNAEYNKAKRYTEDLLTDAIVESRRISHELMPIVLDEFGLTAAVKDVCQQLQDGVKFDCRIELQGVKLDKYFELAVFRTTQELMLNVVKHAEAKQATVEIIVQDGKILVRVEDDGNGIAPAADDVVGIGLASIRNKANLLNGSVNIISRPGKGTIVEVFLTIDTQNNI